ncbi:hypothetical protein CLOACE_05770 [Clostridium acetireducens DSM 10703]|jgi:predicted metal-dependent peptidase|uniref:VWA-like domain-containing protein n=1 Tax=Clostridium acetireducens DSM 10703 TaxID=1121290 RepID=A0A1E8F0L9_9CLOT|nr:VWA-like domain-containing protein [Clostridium acetireducens]OFI06991.1 hypothetical protein CLOACE_05770 [Clostridium acetireducens DSM 10703]
MEQNNNFEYLRKSLLAKIIEEDEQYYMSPQFEKEFFKLIELCTFSLMKGEDNFFALFMIQMKRGIKWDLPTATATKAGVSYFSIYFNPKVFLKCNLEEMKALIKHEVYHIMYGHYGRAKKLRKKYSALAVNLAMDISINQYITHLPSWSSTLENVSLTYKILLEYEKPVEEYAKKIQEGIDSLKAKEGAIIEDDRIKGEEKPLQSGHDESRTHDMWEESDDTFNYEQLKQLIRKMANNANSGKMPATLEKPYKELNQKPQITWKDYLRKIVGTLPVGYKKTITRKDRRQPDRLDLRGKLSDHIIQILIAIDISASMSDEEIKQIMTEVFGIIKNYPSEVKIIECDNEIRRVYKVRGPKDVRKKLDTKGGTAFSPVFNYMKKNRMRNHLLIYFTDGIGENELQYKPVHNKTLWVLTGKNQKLSLAKPYGVVINLSTEEKVEEDFTYMKEMMRDIMPGWAGWVF